MSYRWGKPRKNVKRTDPRYFLNEGEYGVSYEVDVDASRFDIDPDRIPVPAQSEVKKIIEKRLIPGGKMMGSGYVIKTDNMVHFVQKDLDMEDTSDRRDAYGNPADSSKSAATQAVRTFVKENFKVYDFSPPEPTPDYHMSIPTSEGYAIRYGYGVNMFNLQESHAIGFALIDPNTFDYDRDVKDRRDQMSPGGKRFPLT